MLVLWVSESEGREGEKGFLFCLTVCYLSINYLENLTGSSGNRWAGSDAQKGHGVATKRENL